MTSTGGVRRITVPGLRVSKTSSHAVEDLASGLIFISGQTGTDEEGNLPGDVRGQLIIILRRLDTILDSLGLDRSAILRVFTLVTDIDGFYEQGGGSEVWAEYVAAHPPASTITVVPALARPEFKIEIEATLTRAGRS
jgi:enamine deaminase RidA (YjgF/YER057c/UK114 family)